MPSVVTLGELLLALVSVFSAILAVPLTVLIFHLRALRSDQQAKHQEMNRWSEWMQREVNEVRRGIHRLPVDYVGKEEWLRETMRIRQTVERLSEGLARQEVRLDDLTEWGRIRAGLTSAAHVSHHEPVEPQRLKIPRPESATPTGSIMREACS